MRIPTALSDRTTYCTNVHPAESLSEVRAVLRGPVCDVKAKVSPGQPFGVGLRLSARASSELEIGAELSTLADQLQRAGLYVFTLNGFPYGPFHGAPVKEGVYRPDWSEPERVDYTVSLARVLAALLPEELTGSISTVPGAFEERAASSAAKGAIAMNIARAAAELVKIERASGKHLELALEPEPRCALATSDDVVEFFERHLLGPAVLSNLAGWCGLSASHAERTLRRHVGVCLDACHAAVEFERPLDWLRRFRNAGIRVSKVQVSAGLSVRELARHSEALLGFADDVYLHQVVARTPSGLERYLDLGPAIADAPRIHPSTEWRVHFHVPVFQARLDPFSSTQALLLELLESPEILEMDPHLEIETYTFDLLPERYKSCSVVDAVAREIDWTRQALVGRAQREGA